ncbi:sugar phosphate isomerase/epimerase family protein [Gimesia chilikensis]|uniref:Inosose dehydratase n=1 Tax=Gimesia chilikensis TaxID=2605989 RepID=A0A517PHD5_9PLAN|nr:sugar phosphate isomerase/epimerase family protein [Gimesia chilikensis]QDT18787.1 Inosose dehydratase [Gimesia chilikensis]
MAALVSCLTNSYGRFGPVAAIENIRDAGIDHLELNIKNHGVPSFFKETPLLTEASTAEDIAHVKDLLKQHHVKLSSCNITTGNPLDPEVVIKTKRKLDLAHQLGVKLVVGGAGEIEQESDRDTLYQHLREIGDYAGAQGITYCFETHPGICVNAAGMLRTMQDLDHPNLRLNFDTGNINYYNEHANVLESLHEVVTWVKHVHLKDSYCKFKDWNFAALGEAGGVDFLKIRYILEDNNFNGPYSLEIEGIEGEPELTLEEHHNRVKQSVVYLRECGFFE